MSDETSLLLRNTFFEIDGMEDVIDLLSREVPNKGKIYANILAWHGRLNKPPVEQQRPTLARNVNLFVIATRGYQHQVFTKDVFERGAIKYLKVLREGIEEGEETETFFFDEDGCLSELGEKTLANMMIVMGKGQTYSEYYGVEFPETPPDKEHWKAFQRKMPGLWEWSAPFLTLKKYELEYNVQEFLVDTEQTKNRLGVLFQYRDKEGNIKNICLNLRHLIDRIPSTIRLDYILEKLNPLFTDRRITSLNLQFNFTHMACRVNYSEDSASLTRIFSNKNERVSIKCFIKNLFEIEEYKKILREMLHRNFVTIYEFYNKLKEKGKYDEFLDLLSEREKTKARTTEIILFEFIKGVVSELEEEQRMVQEARLAEDQRRAKEEARLRLLDEQIRVKEARVAELVARLAEAKRRAGEQAGLAEEQSRTEEQAGTQWGRQGGGGKKKKRKSKKIKKNKIKKKTKKRKSR